VKINFKAYGHKGILVQWPNEIADSNLLEQQAFLKKIVSEISEIDLAYHTYHEVYVEYKNPINNFSLRKEQLKAIYRQLQIQFDQKSMIWTVPVCYEKDLIPDLKEYLKKKNLSVDELIAMHTSQMYRVYFIGFLPGFLYLGGLSSKLSIDRKEMPSNLIKKGTVAIGGNQTGNYPQDSPGGWYGIGHTPISFFDASNKQPTWANPGDFIQFESISKKELKAIQNRIQNGTFQIQYKVYAN